MVTVTRIKLSSLLNAYKILRKRNINEFNYYSDFNECLIKHIIMGQCYYVVKDCMNIGIFLINKRIKEILYIPILRDSMSLFRLIYMLHSNFNIRGYTISIRHNKLNPKLYKSYFPVDIFDNYKYMYIDTKDILNGSLESNSDIIVRRMVIDKEEPLRVKLQNNIFGNKEGRRELTLFEVYNEEKKSTFLKDMCFILDIEGTPGGYGQILIDNDEYFLVNFGVTAEYRNNGYGCYFLSQIINFCNESGIEKLHLCVDNDNIHAVNLYKKLGFKELYNKFSIRFK